jgi:hypothetical protein
MKHEKLCDFLHLNKNTLKLEGLDINFEESHSGDEYNSESTMIFRIKINDDVYEVGWVNVIEDEKDWAQAESYNYDVCYKNEKYIKPEEVYSVIENFKSIQRDFVLNNILK